MGLRSSPESNDDARILDPFFGGCAHCGGVGLGPPFIDSPCDEPEPDDEDEMTDARLSSGAVGIAGRM